MPHDPIRHNPHNIRHTTRLEKGMSDEDGLFAMAAPEDAPQLVIFDEEHPGAVLHLLDYRLKGKVVEIPEELRNVATEALRASVNPSPTINRLRLNFWYLYDKTVCANEKNKKIRTPDIYKGICQQGYWEEVVDDPNLLAWIMTPVQSYQRAVEDIMETSLSKLSEVVTKGRLVLPDGSIDMKLATILIKIYEIFDKRVHGDYTKKIQGHVSHTSTANPATDGPSLTAEEIQKRLIQFQKEEGR